MEHFSHTGEVVAAIALLLLVAAATLAFTKRLRLPFTVILVLVGMQIETLVQDWPQWFGVLGMLQISPDLILFVFLPTLIFESTFNIDVQRLRQNLGPVLMLAIPGLLLSTLLIGGIVSYVSGLPLIAALLLGAILSATDPVAVIALFRQLGAPKRLAVLVEGESLFNDATSVMLAKILLAVFAAGVFTPQAMVGGVADFLVLFVGGVAAGVFIGWIAGLLLGRVESDALIEISITTATAYLSFLVAESLLHVSGIMATVGAGLTLGGWGRVKISPPVRTYLENFWEYMAFLANALIFLLVGMKISVATLAGEASLLATTIIAMTLARAAVVYGLLPVVGRMPNSEPIGLGYQAVIFWGGLRGAIALAIVLSLGDFPHAEQFTAVVMGAVLFSLLAQGLTMAPLMRRLGLDQPPLMDKLALLQYRLSATRRAMELIPELSRGGEFSARIARRLGEENELSHAVAQKELADLRARSIGPEQEEALLSLRALSEERACYDLLYARGHLGERGYRQLLLTLATQVEALRVNGRFVRIQTHRLRRRVEPILLAVMDALPGFAAWSQRMRRQRLALNYENDWAHFHSASQVLQQLDELARNESVSAAATAAVQARYETWRRRARDNLDAVAREHPQFVADLQERLARRMVLLAAAELAEHQAERGALTHAASEEIIAGARKDIRRLRGVGP